LVPEAAGVACYDEVLSGEEFEDFEEDVGGEVY
jgi:hypothetical protein